MPELLNERRPVHGLSEGTECLAIGRQTHAANRDPFREIFDLWEKSSVSRRKTTIADYRQVFLAFAETLDGKLPRNVSRKDIVEYRDRLIAAGQSQATVSRKISVLKTLFSTALSHELIEKSPMEMVRLRGKPDAKQRVAFSIEDLNRIFQCDIFTAGYRPRGAGREAAFWLPLLALFSGARLEELSQLLVGDVCHADGLGWYLSISDDAEHSQLKNTASRRRIPLHPVLIACGFADSLFGRPPSEFVFPHLKPNPRGKYGGYFSNFFSGYLREKIGITDRRKVFHSFRHTFKEYCRTAGIEEAVHDALTGHTAPSVGRRYGNELYPLEPLFDAVARLEFRGLDLSHLYTKPISRSARISSVKMVSAFYGTMVAYAPERLARGRPPFIVAIYQDCEALIDIQDKEILSGSMPEHKLTLVLAWMEIHREELLANWQAGLITGDYFKIDPLR